MNRLKVLISAHELSPYQGSECAEGWNLVTRIARYHDVTVLYARGSQFSPDAYETAIKKYYTENQNEFNIQFIPVSQPKTTLWLASINKVISKNNSSIGIPFLYFIGYRLWQQQAFRIAKSLLDSCALRLEPFVLCHHLTQITFREPGYLWKLQVPFVWGPTGGNTTIPLSFYPHIGLRSAASETFRTLTNWLTLRFSSRINQAIKKSSLMYAFSAEDQELFQRRGAKRVELMLDAGCEVPTTGRSTSPPSPSPALASLAGEGAHLHNLQPATCNRLRVLWCGQLIKRKALEILLKAVAGDEDLKRNVEITIVGDGRFRKKYENLIKKLFSTTYNLQPATCNLQPATNITFTGWLSRAEVFAHMQHSDVLVHTSYREATSNVIPEAFSCGLPVICHDISGMSIAVTENCGMKIPLNSYNQSIIGFRNALKQITHNPQLITDLKSGALRRTSELSWDSMAERISNAYNEIL